MQRKFRVIAGPYRIARSYAERRGWTDDEFFIVTRGHQLAKLDPALIAEIIMVQLDRLGRRILQEIQEEINRVRVLWPAVPAVAEA